MQPYWPILDQPLMVQYLVDIFENPDNWQDRGPITTQAELAAACRSAETMCCIPGLNADDVRIVNAAGEVVYDFDAFVKKADPTFGRR
jgi:hypothetical protein